VERIVFVALAGESDFGAVPVVCIFHAVCQHFVPKRIPSLSGSLPNFFTFNKRSRGVPSEEWETPQKEIHMLWTIFIILLVLWLLGLITGYTLGNFIWLLLVAAVVVLIIQLISGRRTL
jgi:Family of unknown function (DUF5670)